MTTYDYCVTGGAGFIGKHFVDLLIEKGHSVCVIDKFTYAADKVYIEHFHKQADYINIDIEDIENIPKCGAIINFAAESHVDNSISTGIHAAKSNFMGVLNLLERVISMDDYDQPIFLQISTDEVYGDIKEGSFKESDKLIPSNPYSATKASAEHLVTSYGRTYGIRHLITRSSNNFGNRQFPEKLIPRAIECLKHNREFPVHGNGEYVRNWLHVKDNCSAIYKLLKEYELNSVKFDNDKIFNIGGSVYKTNLQILTMLEEIVGKPIKKKFIKNRLGQDVRYSIDTTKLTQFTDWKEEYILSHKILKEIYLSN